MLFGPDSSEGRFERLVARCRELFEAGDRTQMEALLRRHDDLAARVRERVLGPSGPGDAGRSAAAAPEPQRIGPFEVLGLLGEGGMGRVYLAQQVAPVRRRVAIKVIRAGLDSRAVLARFEAERQALAMLDHDNVARVLEAGATEAGQPYFVMEYIRGEPLTEHCNRHRLDTRARVELFVDLCRAVQHAHERGVVHRDLKPANVLVAQQQGGAVVKVIDFGVACAIDRTATRRATLTEHGQVIGTPQYMAPEQGGGSRVVDARCDVYSLGVMLCELLCGALQFDRSAALPAGCLERHTREFDEDPAVPSTIVLRGLPEARAAAAASAETLVGELRGDLDWITFKALRTDPADRYQSVRELAEDLQSYLGGGAVSAGPPGFWHRLRRVARRRRPALRVAAVALFAAAAGAGAVLGLLGGAHADMSTRPDVMPMVRLEPSSRIGDELRVTNDGQAKVLVQFVDASGRQLRTVEVSGGQAVTQSMPLVPLVAATPVEQKARVAKSVPATSDRSRQVEPVCCMDCLASGTLVQTCSGPLPIEQVAAGAQLLTADGGLVKVLSARHALGVELWELSTTSAGGVVRATAGHPFLTVARGWVAASDLSSGDALRGADGGTVELLGAQSVPGAAVVWSLELEPADAAILVGDVGLAAAGSRAALTAFAQSGR